MFPYMHFSQECWKVIITSLLKSKLRRLTPLVTKSFRVTLNQWFLLCHEGARWAQLLFSSVELRIPNLSLNHFQCLFQSRQLVMNTTACAEGKAEVLLQGWTWGVITVAIPMTCQATKTLPSVDSTLSWCRLCGCPSVMSMALPTCLPNLGGTSMAWILLCSSCWRALLRELYLLGSTDTTGTHCKRARTTFSTSAPCWKETQIII
jgi:hypothetical protein